MAGFFDALPPPLKPPEDAYRMPPWAAPPENVLGADVALRLVLARTEELAVAIVGATAYPSGVTLNLTLRLRTPREHPDFFHPFLHQARGLDPDDLFKFGVQLADGSKATTLEHRALFGREEPPGPVLMPRGGGGGGRSWDWGVWLWPLPPPGSITFVCEWPAQGVAESRADVDAAPIIEAAARAEVLWEDDSPAPGSASHMTFYG
jgi:hypothetical protein